MSIWLTWLNSYLYSGRIGPWLWAFGVELNKATLLGHLFADFHYVLEKKEKVSVQLTLSIWWIGTLSACVTQAVSVFTAVKIRTDEPGVEPQTVFFFFIFSKTNWKPAYKGTLEGKDFTRFEIVTYVSLAPSSSITDISRFVSQINIKKLFLIKFFQRSYSTRVI